MKNLKKIKMKSMNVIDNIYGLKDITIKTDKYDEFIFTNVKQIDCQVFDISNNPIFTIESDKTNLSSIIFAN